MANIAINEKTVKGMLLVGREDKLVDKYFGDCDTVQTNGDLSFVHSMLVGAVWDSKDNSYSIKLLYPQGIKVCLRLIKFGKVDMEDVARVLESVQKNVDVEVRAIDKANSVLC